MSKGNEQNNSKKNIQYIAFTTIILIIIATLIIVKTYFSKADKWIILKNSSSDKISTSYSILTQNLFAKSSFLQSDLTNVTSLVEYKEQTWYQKIFENIRNFFINLFKKG